MTNSERVYFTSTLIADAANKAVASAVSKQDGAVEYLGALLLSFCAFEAFIHDLFGWLDTEADFNLGGDFKKLHLLDQLNEKTFIKDRICITNIIFLGAEPNWGERPFQDFELLRKIRNELTHFKTETIQISALNEHTRQGSIGKLLNALEAKVKINDYNSGVSWAQVICNRKVLSWACETIQKMISHLVSIIPANSEFNRFAEDISVHMVKKP